MYLTWTWNSPDYLCVFKLKIDWKIITWRFIEVAWRLWETWSSTLEMNKLRGHYICALQCHKHNLTILFYINPTCFWGFNEPEISLNWKIQIFNYFRFKFRCWNLKNSGFIRQIEQKLQVNSCEIFHIVDSQAITSINVSTMSLLSTPESITGPISDASTKQLLNIVLCQIARVFWELSKEPISATIAFVMADAKRTIVQTPRRLSHHLGNRRNISQNFYLRE